MSAAPAVPLAVLATAGFCASAGIRLLDPLLPMIAGDFETEVGRLGGVVAAFALPYGLGQIALGPLGDRLGKLRVVAIALLLYGAAHLLAAGTARDLFTLGTLRACAGAVAGAIMPLLLAHLGDTVAYADRQAVIGRFLTGSVMAFLLTGPLAGLAAQWGGWRLAFVLFGVAATGIGVLLTVRLGSVLWQPAGAARGSALAAYLALLRRPSGRWILLAAAIDGTLLLGGAFPFVGSFLIERFALSAGEAGLVVACFGIGVFAYTRLARRLVARFGEARLLLGGCLVVAAGLAGLSLAPGWAAVLALQPVLGFGFFTLHGTLQARATEALPEARGTSVAAFVMALFIGQSIGSVLFGALIAAQGYRAGFAVAAAATLLFGLWARRG